jgi:hypothetical protein
VFGGDARDAFSDGDGIAVFRNCFHGTPVSLLSARKWEDEIVSAARRREHCKK